MDALAPIRSFDRFQQRHKPLALLFATIRKNGEDQSGSFAVAVAFYAFFAVFPLLLVFVTILGYVLAGDHALMTSVRKSVLGQFPVIGQTLQHNRLHGDVLALASGVALSLWSSLGVTGAMITALDHVWAIPPHERAGFLRAKLRGLLVLLAVGSLFVVASGASGAVSSGLGGGALLYLGGIVVSFLVNVGVFLISFRFLCSAPPAWRKLLPGAIAAGVMWTALQLLGGFYIDHIKQSNSAYGTFALVLGILAWLHLGAQLTMYCAELNTVLAGRRWPRALLGGEPLAEGAISDSRPGA
ncbi:MAG: YihY/virulence factor BrkB family protein [Acidobacteriota bacterium]|nr:YihY/virulence factor BrkB family protein [Acidobacteriota bacterium]